ncbi:MAG TPA: HAD family phosphatase [Flexilinea sp.]|nr:HAD family phosphatase [Flexilinea sp.]HPJ64648.1 HAD family phosphatase [Flexilinea sp.]HPR71201.1 HAD family phosphatase [Flexilinea sp.]HQG09004.1 HAD family phosphatase [Dysgonamonadaceae bacterium]
MDFAVLWDLDGTISDSFQCFYMALERILSEQKPTIKITPEEYKSQYFGATFPSILERMYQGQLSNAQIWELNERYFRYSVEFAKQGSVFPIPGIGSFLEELHANNIRMAIASSSTVEMIFTELDVLGFISYFDNIISGNLLPSKPAPDVFQVAAASIRAQPSHCVVIEDSVAGITAAKNAGMRSVAVTTTNPPDKFREADYVVEDFRKFDLDTLKSLFSD